MRTRSPTIWQWVFRPLGSWMHHRPDRSCILTKENHRACVFGIGLTCSDPGPASIMAYVLPVWLYPVSSHSYTAKASCSCWWHWSISIGWVGIAAWRGCAWWIPPSPGGKTQKGCPIVQAAHKQDLFKFHQVDWVNGLGGQSHWQHCAVSHLRFLAVLFFLLFTYVFIGRRPHNPEKKYFKITKKYVFLSSHLGRPPYSMGSNQSLQPAKKQSRMPRRLWKLHMQKPLGRPNSSSKKTRDLSMRSLPTSRPLNQPSIHSMGRLRPLRCRSNLDSLFFLHLFVQKNRWA